MLVTAMAEGCLHEGQRYAGWTEPHEIVLCVPVLASREPGERLGSVVHELGHLLGLEHTTEPGNIMNPSWPGTGWTITDEQAEAVRR